MPANDHSTVAVLLAAGLSRRFGGIKQLANVVSDEGEASLLEQGVKTLLKSKVDRLVVATGDYHSLLAELDLPNVTLLKCPNSAQGLGHTIADVASYLRNEQEYFSHILFFLADQVAVSFEEINRLIETSLANPERLVSAQFDLSLSPPVIFPRAYIGQLTQLEGDKGAKAILLSHKENLIPVRMNSASVDIDTQLELDSWNHQIKNKPKISKQREDA